MDSSVACFPTGAASTADRQPAAVTQSHTCGPAAEPTGRDGDLVGRLGSDQRGYLRAPRGGLRGRGATADDLHHHRQDGRGMVKWQNQPLGPATHLLIATT